MKAGFTEKNIASAEKRQFASGAKPRHGVHRAVFGNVCRDKQFIKARFRCFRLISRLKQLDFKTWPGVIVKLVALGVW